VTREVSPVNTGVMTLSEVGVRHGLEVKEWVFAARSGRWHEH
jgi:hypothetical protein